jgi:hypothetical protein
MKSSRWRSQVLATRGERLVLCRTQFTGEVGAGGQILVEILTLIEADASGRYAALVVFDVDDLDSAYAELEKRYTDGEAVSARRAALTRVFTQAFAARDWHTLSTVLAPDLVVTDHRLLGWEPLHGPAAYIQALNSLVDLAPDVRLRIDHLTMSDPRFLYVTTWEGTREGGTFETPSVVVCELDPMGRIRRFDQYDLDQLEEVRTRFEAVGARVASDPLRIPPNAATRAMDRWRERAEARDWEALTDLFVPTFVFEDRRRLFRDSGDRDKLLASVRLAVSAGALASHTTLATAGDRLALGYLRFSSFDGTMLVFEVEAFQVTEVDAEGRVVAAITFDPDDRRAASLEMSDRYFRGEGARWTPPSWIEFARALNDHDLHRMRAALPDDFVFHDHRRTGVGRIGNADDYVASLAAVYEQSPDATFATLYQVAADTHASLSVGRMFGTLVDGGEVE